MNKVQIKKSTNHKPHKRQLFEDAELWVAGNIGKNNLNWLKLIRYEYWDQEYLRLQTNICWK